MTWSQIIVALLISIAGKIISADPALSLDKLARYNAYLAIRLVVRDGRSAHENIFFSDLAAYESQSIQLCRSFGFYVAAIKYNIIYMLNIIKLDMSLPCCFFECAIPNWVGGINQWEEDALATLKGQNFESLAAFSPRHFQILQKKIEYIKLVRSDYCRKKENRDLIQKLFEREKACLARSNIDIYMLIPFPTWAPFHEKTKSREWLERRDNREQKKRRKEYEIFWEQTLSNEKSSNHKYTNFCIFSPAIFVVKFIRQLLGKLRGVKNFRSNTNAYRRLILAYLLSAIPSFHETSTRF